MRRHDLEGSSVAQGLVRMGQPTPGVCIYLYVCKYVFIASITCFRAAVSSFPSVASLIIYVYNLSDVCIVCNVCMNLQLASAIFKAAFFSFSPICGFL